MSTSIPLSELSGVQIAELVELGIIELDSTTTPAPNGAFTPSDEHIEVYKGWITPREAYNLLHPIAKKGSCTAKAVLNSLPVTGTVSVANLKKGWRGSLTKSGVETIATVEDAKGRITRSTYAQRTNADGKTMDGRAPLFFQAGGRLIVDERAQTASLRTPKDFEFSDEQVLALTEVIG